MTEIIIMAFNILSNIVVVYIYCKRDLPARNIVSPDIKRTTCETGNKKVGDDPL